MYDLWLHCITAKLLLRLSVRCACTCMSSRIPERTLVELHIEKLQNVVTITLFKIATNCGQFDSHYFSVYIAKLFTVCLEGSHNVS